MTDLFGNTVRRHDGLTFHGPPAAPKPHREGLRREHAKDSRDANYAEHKASGSAATQRDDLLRHYADPRLARRGLNGLTDQEAARMFAPPIPASTVSARRNELLKHEPGPLVAKAGARRPCCVTGRTVQPWTLTDAGRALLAQLLHR